MISNLLSLVKTIGMLGSIAIAVNSLAGPAILQLPFQFQQSGIIPTIACLLFISVLSAYVCLHTANTISSIPHNTNFQKCIEFSDPYRYFINGRMYTITQILFLLTSVILNVAAIIDTAEGTCHKTKTYHTTFFIIMRWI
jgi:amino acid permease